MSRPPVSAAQQRWLRPAVVLLLCALGAGATLGGIAPGVRVVALLLFLLFGPGVALVGLLRIGEGWRELTLVIGVSLAVDLMVVTVLAYSGARGSGAALAALIGIAVVAAGAQVAVPVLRRRREETAS
jgi:hypothetical protein